MLRAVLFWASLCTTVAAGTSALPCLNAWAPLSFHPSNSLVYAFKVEQSILPFHFTPHTSLLDLVDQPPKNPYASVEGILTLTPQCRSSHSKQHFRATIESVRVQCRSKHKDEVLSCQQHWGELEMLDPPFYFAWSTSGTISDISTSPVLTNTQVAAVQTSLISNLGVTSMQGGSNSSCAVIHNAINDHTVKQMVDTTSGLHGEDPDQQYPSNSISLHRLSGPSATSTIATATIADPEEDKESTPTHPIKVVTKAESRLAFLVDVHGTTKSGRTRPHHLTHTSSILELVPSSKVPIEKTGAPKVALPPQFRCSSTNLRQKYEKYDAPAFVSVANPLVLLDVADTATARKTTTNAELSPSDVAKYITNFLTLITDAKDAILTGYGQVKTTLNDVEALRLELFGDDTKYCREPELRNGKKNTNSITEQRVAAKSRGENPDDIMYLRRKICINQEVCDAVPDKKYEGGVCELSEFGQLGSGIRIIKDIELFLNDSITDLNDRRELVKQDIAGLGGNEEATKKKLQKFLKRIKAFLVDELSQKCTSKLNQVIDFFSSRVEEVLNKMTTYKDTNIIKNLKPLTEMITKVIRVLGPVAEAVVGQKDNIQAGLEGEALLSKLPSKVKELWTGTEAYKKLFDAKEGLFEKLNVFINNSEQENTKGTTSTNTMGGRDG